MNTKFLKENIIIIIVALVAAILGIVYLGKIGHQSFIYLPLKESGSGFKIIGSAALITLFLERALEILMNLWREPNKVEFKTKAKEVNGDIEQLKHQIEDINKDVKASKDLSFIEDNKKLIEHKEETIAEQKKILATINTRLEDYKAISQQYAHVLSFSIGIFICLGGFGVLNEVFDYNVLETKTLELNENGKKVTEAIASYQISDSILNTFPKIDTLNYIDAEGNKKVFANPMMKVKQNNEALTRLLKDETVVQSFKKAKSNKQQQSLFMILNLLITALLLSGGTEGMHKLASVYMSFLNKTKDEFELTKPNKK